MCVCVCVFSQASVSVFQAEAGKPTGIADWTGQYIKMEQEQEHRDTIEIGPRIQLNIDDTSNGCGNAMHYTGDRAHGTTLFSIQMGSVGRPCVHCKSWAGNKVLEIPRTGSCH